MEEIKNCILEAARFLDRDAGVADTLGKVLASTRPDEQKREDPEAVIFASGDDFFAVRGDRSYARLDRDDKSSAVVYVEGTDAAAHEILELLLRWMRSALLERNTDAERQSFLKNVLLENELPGDIPLKAREYKVIYAQPRQALLLRLSVIPEVNPVHSVREVLGTTHEDDVLAVDEENIVILLRTSPEHPGRTEEIAGQILARFDNYGDCDLHIGVGLPAETLKDTSKSYREASLALTVGRIFEEERRIMWYNRLGLGRLIYQLPPTLCEMFLSEVFAPDTYEALDTETLLTIEKFFENNLNGSETSRQLFVHRNTLVYRLDKVQKITGLDLRSFDDAVLFKLAAMVRKYLESLQRQGAPKVSGRRW